MQISPDWLNLARINAPVTVAAAAMKCNKATAARRLDQARAVLGTLATPRQEKTVALLLASGVVRQDTSRRRWQDVLLGYKQAA